MIREESIPPEQTLTGQVIVVLTMVAVATALLGLGLWSA